MGRRAHIWTRRDARSITKACSTSPAPPRPHLGREEIRPGNRAPMRPQKRLLRGRALRHGGDPCALRMRAIVDGSAPISSWPFGRRATNRSRIARAPGHLRGRCRAGSRDLVLPKTATRPAIGESFFHERRILPDGAIELSLDESPKGATHGSARRVAGRQQTQSPAFLEIDRRGRHRGQRHRAGRNRPHYWRLDGNAHDTAVMSSNFYHFAQKLFKE